MVSGLFYCVGEMVVLYSEDEEIRRLNFVLGLIYREFVSLAVFIDEDIEIGDKFSSCPAFGLMNCIYAIRK